MNWRLGIGWVLGALVQASLACPNPQAVIVPSYPTPPYSEVAQLLKPSLERLGIPAVLAALPHPSFCPKLWIALGSEAAAKIRQQDATTPLLIGLVLDAKTVLQFAPATGVYLEHSLHIKWRSFRRVFPRVRHLCVLYDPRFAAHLSELDRLAQADGVLLTKQKVESAQELSKVLERVPEEVEALWPLGDGKTFSLLTARPLFLFTQRKGLVLVGLSARWVEAGAALALDWNWPGIAAQLAELGQALWRGGLPADYSPQPPCCTRLVTKSQIQSELVSRKSP
ncbi:MAG: hypothetical protein N3A55_08320 [Methylohalobius sp.]|nr:hypothetical protein [Methylohalobius sp.]